MKSKLRGLSLLELLVAMAIMAIALGLLYRASGGSARSIGDAARYQKAIFIAESLLASHETVSPDGWAESGVSAGYSWQVSSQPYVTDVARANPAATPLYAVTIIVRWGEALAVRNVEVNTLRPVRKVPLASAGAGG